MLSYKKGSGFSPKAVSKVLREKKRKEKPNKDDRKRKTPKPSNPRRTRSENRSQTNTQVNVDTRGLFEMLGKAFDFYHNKKQAQGHRDAELDHTILGLARDHKGLLAERIMTDMKICSKEEAQGSFARLLHSGKCRFLCVYQNEPIFVFPSLVPRIWNCDFCESQFEVKEHHTAADCHSCCNCGAQLQWTVAD